MPRRLGFGGFLLAMLVGCGGGGGSGSVPGSGNGDTGGGDPPATGGADLQTSVPAPVYNDANTAGFSERTELFNRINTIRARLGLGLLAQHPALDTAAENHSIYAGAAQGAERIYAVPGGDARFTGATPQDRCAHAGYTGQCPDDALWGGSIWAFDPYQGALVLTQGAREMGVSSRGDLFMIPVMPYVQLGYPAASTPQRQAAGFRLVAWLWGAFHVHVNAGESLAIDAFEVRDAAGHRLTGQTLTAQSDPYRRLPAHATMFIPDAGETLTCGERFTLYFAGRRDGVPFTIDQTVELAEPFCCASPPCR